ncbi:Kelch repeat-containing protein [Mycobacterium tilburgii]|uniref:Kelch repeat-containing protein n=1 Tax=Mycobacterium tilburgii TaxID=44467 RepID=UPI00164280EA
MAIVDGQLVAVGGVSGGQVLKSVSVFDLTARTLGELPDMSTPRHGVAVAAVKKFVYAIGGSSAVGAAGGLPGHEGQAVMPRVAAQKPQPSRRPVVGVGFFLPAIYGPFWSLLMQLLPSLLMGAGGIDQLRGPDCRVCVTHRDRLDDRRHRNVHRRISVP